MFMKYLSLIMFVFFAHALIADDVVVPIDQYRWVSAPTILKTSRINGANGASCRSTANFELCVGPATTSATPAHVTIVKCFIPANTYTCPTTLSTDKGCAFADMDGNITPPTPACTEDRQFDGFPGGCSCSNFGNASLRGTLRDCVLARDRGRAAEVARLCCTGRSPRPNCRVNDRCSLMCENFRRNPIIYASCPGATPVVVETETAPAPPSSPSDANESLLEFPICRLPASVPAVALACMLVEF